MSGIQGVQAQPLNVPSPFLGAAPPTQIQVPDPSGRFNPLQAQGQALQNQGQANANQLSQMDVQKAVAQRAIGQHLQQTLNPDGTPNWGAALTAAANDSHSAYGMQDLVHAAIANGNIQAGTAQTILENATKKYQNMLDITLPALNKGNNVNLGDAASLVAKGAAAGLYDPATGIDHINAIRQAAPDQMGPNGQYAPNPKLAQLLQGFANQAAGSQNALNNVLGSPTFRDVGGEQIPVTTPQQGPARVTGAPLVNTPSPDALNAPQTSVDAQGRPFTQAAGNARQFLNGDGQVVNPAAPGTAATALDPQSQDVIQNYAPQLRAAADKAGPALTTLTNLQKVMAVNPQQFGASATAREGLAKLFQTVPGMPQSVVDGVAGGNLSSYQEARKLMFMANANLAPSGTDQESEAARQALLNPDADPRATAAVLAQIKRQAEMPVLQAQAYQKFYDKQGSSSPYIDPRTKKPATIGQFPSLWRESIARSGRTGMASTPAAGAPPQAPQQPGPDGSVPQGITP